MQFVVERYCSVCTVHTDMFTNVTTIVENNSLIYVPYSFTLNVGRSGAVIIRFNILYNVQLFA